MSQNDTIVSRDTFTATDAITQPDTPGKKQYYNPGLTYYNDEKYLAAIQLFDSCLILDSAFKEARLMRGMCWEKEGELEKALADYEYLTARDTYHDLLDRRIKILCISVILSKNWYYMIAMMLIVILLMALAVKSVSYRRG